MITVNDMVEDWIQIRSTLQRQLKALDSGQLQTAETVPDGTTKATIARVRICVDELNTLLKEYAGVRRG